MRVLIAAAVLAVATAGQAVAQDFDLMQFADTNGDGKVTVEEYAAFNEQGWGFIAQGAEKVKPAELDAMMQPAFNGITPDAEGYVTQAAYLAIGPTRFKAADKDGDGALNSAELNATMQPPS